MSDKLTDHDIASLYQKGAEEQPSNRLDEQILQLAKNQTPTNQVSPIVKKRRFYQTRYAQLSTAASFILVAVIYFEMNKPLYQEPALFDQQSINTQSDTQEMQNDQFLTAPMLMKKSEQAARLKQTKSRTQKTHSKMDQSIEMAPQESQIMERSDNLLSSKEITTNYTLESELLAIEIAFKEIERILNQGDSKKANTRLKALIASNPELEEVLNNRYQALKKQIVPEP